MLCNLLYYVHFSFLSNRFYTVLPILAFFPKSHKFVFSRRHCDILHPRLLQTIFLKNRRGDRNNICKIYMNFFNLLIYIEVIIYYEDFKSILNTFTKVLKIVYF